MTKVVILGGGVAGLSAAHELVARGFELEVYEKFDVFGGKARSIDNKGSGVGGRRDLPGEHGFRFFPGFYRNLPDTMKRIPFKLNKRGVFDNLLPVPRCELAQDSEKPLEIPIQLPRSLQDLGRILRTARDWKRTGLENKDVLFFAAKMLRFMASCDDRRQKEYEATSWWEYIGADSRSAAYRKFLAEGLTRSLVAMKAKTASTRTVASILTQMSLDLVRVGGTPDRVLNGPTSDVWIDPWVMHLRGQGVELHANCTATELKLDDARGQLDGVWIVRERRGMSSVRTLVQGDYYVAAVPVEAMETLLERSPDLEAREGSLKDLKDLQVEWMNGVQFYLKRDVSIVRGHTVYLDSPWALTSISQRQFWEKSYDFSQMGNGQVRGILSVDISDWNTPGDRKHRKPASQCNEKEIKEEVWEQIKAHLQWSREDALYDDDLVDPKNLGFLDPGIVTPEDVDDILRLRRRQTAGETVRSRAAVVQELLPDVERFKKAGAKVFNTEPLLINTINSLKARPHAVTEVPNLFLASDYVRTSTDIATMEAANEAARRAVNGVLQACGSREQPCHIFNLDEPFFFEPLKQLDKMLLEAESRLDDPTRSRATRAPRRTGDPRGIE